MRAVVPQSPANPTSFPTTRWTEIGRLQSMSVEERRAALGDFLAIYQPAMEAYIRDFFANLQDADVSDFVQGFTADRILDSDLIAKASAKRGRLRALLKVACRNYCLTHLAKASKEPKWVTQHVETIADTASQSFERSWVEIIASEAADQVEAYFRSRGRDDYIRLLRLRILDPAKGNTVTISPAQLSAELGVSQAVMRSQQAWVKLTYIKFMRDIVAEYTKSSDGVDDELAELRRLLS